jgi:multidrug/hemolysin transport system ATP-binding protein
MLCTLLPKDDGEVVINSHTLGKDDQAIRRSIGVVFQHPMLDEKLTVRQNLSVRGAFYQLSPKEVNQRIENLRSLLNLDYLDQPYKTLSGGQKRKADIARALIHEPSLLFLDEPTTGLDPKTRKDVWDVIARLQAQKMTIFLTTHYMEEASQADQIVILHKGKIAAEGSPDFLKKTYAKDTLRLAGNLHQTILHSDQGYQYQVKLYEKYLKDNGIIQSMSRKGNTLDNTPTENFFGRLKEEVYYPREYSFTSLDEVKQTIHQYIRYYN